MSAVDFTEASPRSADGTALHTYHWSSATEPVVAELLIVHGYAEHGARYREFAHALAQHGIACTAIDYRGHGKAEGRRGYCNNFFSFHDDIDVGWQGLEGDHPRFMLGHSHGGLLALDYVSHGHAEGIAGLIISNAFLDVAMDVAPLKAKVADFAARFFPKLLLPSGIPAEGISHDLDMVAAYKRDPLVFSTANAGWFSEVKRAQDRVKSLRSLPCPLYYVYSDKDPITSSAENRRLAEQLESPDKTTNLREGEFHEVLNETNRAELHETIASWVLAHLD